MFSKTKSSVTRTRSQAGRAAMMIAAFALFGFLAWVFGSYARDIDKARRRISTGSQVVQTACGPIEYADAGSGAPILIVHGAGGGFDQGMDIGKPLVEQGFRAIAMSRFGYLRTPLPADASPEAQAEAHACLLDTLQIQRAAVIGVSAGAPSAMQFALRHPDRTSALILMVPAAYPRSQEQTNGGAAPAETSALVRTLVDAMLRSDFLFWAAPKLAPAAIDESFLGTPANLIETASPTERAAVEETLEHLLPFSVRRLGVLNDAKNENPLPRYDLEHISAATLIISTADDGYGTSTGARYSAEHIPGAQLIIYPTGGHVLLGHMTEAVVEITSFVESAAKYSLSTGG